MHFGGGTQLSRHLRRDRAGSFVLYEVVLSVIVLTVLGCFTVRMLIYAKNTNAKAYDLYKGLSEAISAVEIVKSLPHPDGLAEADFGPGYEVLVMGSAIDVTGRFDEKWNPMDSDTPEEEVCYYVRVKVAPSAEPDGFTEESPMLYRIDVEITRVAPYVLEKHGGYQVFSLQATKCFTSFTK